MDHIVTFGEGGQVYLYEHVAPGDDGVLEAQAVVIMKRPHGFMVALPADVLSAEEVRQGEHASMEAEVGPSFQAQVGAAQLTDEGGGARAGDSFCLRPGHAKSVSRAVRALATGLGLGPATRDSSGARCLLLGRRGAPPRTSSPPSPLKERPASSRSLGLPVQAEALFYQSRRGQSG